MCTGCIVMQCILGPTLVPLAVEHIGHFQCNSKHETIQYAFLAQARRLSAMYAPGYISLYGDRLFGPGCW